MNEYSDQEIVQGLKNRHKEVVSFITREYLPMIVYLVERMRGSRQDAEDIFQEALIIIIKKVDKDELQLTAKFSTYLYAVSKNLWLYQLKEQKREKEYLNVFFNDVYQLNPEENKAKELQEKQFLHYYEQLSDVCRKILKLYWLNLPVKKIANDLGNTEKYIRKRKYECKSRFVKLILENKDKI